MKNSKLQEFKDSSPDKHVVLLNENIEIFQTGGRLTEIIEIIKLKKSQNRAKR